MLKNKRFYHGINLGGWLSQCDYTQSHLDNYITEDDFKIIASWGADHVRIPIDYNILEMANGGYDEKSFIRIDNAIEVCKKNNLNCIIDLHKTAGFSFDKNENETGFFTSPDMQERFYKLWEAIADRYKNEYKNVAFELLNEITDKEYSNQWNIISRECIKRIRKYAPETLIMWGSYHNNSAEALKDLGALPDHNVIYNFHCYEPLKFTHQSATWTDEVNPEERISYKESGCSQKYFEEIFAPALKAAKDNNAVLYCGEYGVIDCVSPEDTIKWFHDINAVFEKYQIGRCAWTYKEMDFSLSDKRLANIRKDLLKYI